MTASPRSVRIQAVIFDWGGVIQRTTSLAPRHALDAKLDLAPGTVEAAVFNAELWRLASIGQCSADRAWEGICDQLGIPIDEVDDFANQFFCGDFVDGALIDLIGQLRASGCKLGLLSNATPGFGSSPSQLSRWGRRGLFDRQVFSYQVGALKPDPRMYHAILSALDVGPELALFIDDARANIAGAQAVGIHGHLYHDNASLRQALTALGVGSEDTGP